MGLGGNTLGDTDMDDHRRVAFSVFGHSHFLIPLPPPKKNHFKNIIFWIIFVGWVWRGG
jgi:hypothetical protein